MANRLSADPAASVLVLEAGPRDKNRFIHIPAAFAKLFRSEVDWDYLTEPQKQLDGREIYWPRGKMLGGSSSMNAMMWVRGFAADYDEWAAPGESGLGLRASCASTSRRSRKARSSSRRSAARAARPRHG